MTHIDKYSTQSVDIKIILVFRLLNDSNIKDSVFPHCFAFTNINVEIAFYILSILAKIFQIESKSYDKLPGVYVYWIRTYIYDQGKRRE